MKKACVDIHGDFESFMKPETFNPAIVQLLRHWVGSSGEFLPARIEVHQVSLMNHLGITGPGIRVQLTECTSGA